jgi:DNA-binding FrmR family transcriptional regulator
MDHACHKENLKRLKRISGQVNGLMNMVESEKYCLDILTQSKAIRKALESVERIILEKHLRHCVKDALENKKDTDKKIEEIVKILKQT